MAIIEATHQVCDQGPAPDSTHHLVQSSPTGGPMKCRTCRRSQTQIEGRA
jgi:hypothetical protein